MSTSTNLNTRIATDNSASFSERFSLLCKELESWRLLLMAAFVLFQGCVLVPAVVLVASFYDIGITGLSVFLMAFGMVGVLVSNMAELNMKLILIIFLMNVLVSISLIAAHLLV